MTVNSGTEGVETEETTWIIVMLEAARTSRSAKEKPLLVRFIITDGFGWN